MIYYKIVGALESPEGLVLQSPMAPAMGLQPCTYRVGAVVRPLQHPAPPGVPDGSGLYVLKEDWLPEWINTCIIHACSSGCKAVVALTAEVEPGDLLGVSWECLRVGRLRVARALSSSGVRKLSRIGEFPVDRSSPGWMYRDFSESSYLPDDEVVALNCGGRGGGS